MLFARSRLLRSLLLTATTLWVLCVSCSNAGQAPVDPDVPEDPQLRPPVDPDFASLDVLGSRALARRFSLDLNASVDFQAIESAISARGIGAGIDVAMQSERFTTTVAGHIGRAFGSRGQPLDDLTILARDDADLANQLNGRLLMEIANESALSIEKTLATSTPVFSSLFRGTSSVVTADVASFWDLSGAPAWPGRTELSVEYLDNRPALGVLSQNSFFVSANILGGKATGDSSRAGLKLLEQIRCMDLHDQSAHDFSELPASIGSAGAIADWKMADPSCSGCHRPLAAASGIFQGFGNVGAIADYRTYDSSRGGAWPNAWFGRKVSSWDELANILADDEAIQECLTRRVFETLVQRPVIHGRDTPRMAVIPSKLRPSGASSSAFALRDWIKLIESSSATTSGPTLRTSKVSRAESQVQKLRWMSPDLLLKVLAHAVPLAEDDLEQTRLTSDSVFDGDHQGAMILGLASLPVSYFGNIIEVIESAAFTIIDKEFGAGVGQADRSLFTGIGGLTELTPEEATVELARISEQLTGQIASEAKTSRLREIYELANQNSDASDAAERAKDGLTAGLIAILASPGFLSY